MQHPEEFTLTTSQDRVPPLRSTEADRFCSPSRHEGGTVESSEQMFKHLTEHEQVGRSEPGLSIYDPVPVGGALFMLANVF